MIQSERNTICALATPTGGAIAVVRVSGSQCYSLVGKLLKTDISCCRPNTLHHTQIYSTTGEEIDDAVLTFYRAPHSYTGEDAIEISCHGSPYIVYKILESLTKAGCYQAEPGEYTRRAYLNGKMDLSQAEAVADLISSSNRASHQLAIGQLKGHVRTELELLRERLLKLTSMLELELDFSDHDDLVFANRDELCSLAVKIDQCVSHLAETYHIGKAVKEGIPVAIIGKTNVGKSTLLNQLVGEERALVSDIHGTTRDSIEATAIIGGLTFRFIDTAGLRHTDDVVEQMGIERALKKMEQAQLVLWVIDSWPSQSEKRGMFTQCKDKKTLLVFNKADINNPPLSAQEIHLKSSDPGSQLLGFYTVSAKTGLGISHLEEAIRQAVEIPEIHETDVIITSARQYALLNSAHKNMVRVIEALKNDLSSDLVAEELRQALDTLGDATGIQRITPQDTLNNIFGSFCVGK